MTYKETIDYLYHVAPAFEKVGASAYKEGLSNTLAFDERFGHPHQKYQTIHVAGTNGKGTTAHSLASILMADGYRVGLYTSPHLTDFRERIRVNGDMIPEQYVIDFVEQNRDYFSSISPSFFEITTALAFSYFAEAKVDISVIEVGLGGRLDCTNIITPQLCVITNISLDHTQFLGNTLAKIAAEKAGIIKRGVPVVIGEHTEETRKVFADRARELAAPIVFAQDEPEVIGTTSRKGNYETFATRTYGEIATDLSGDFQAKNVNTILHATTLLLHNGIIRRKESVREGLMHVTESTHLCGRWQTLSRNPRIIADTGHNPAAWKEISQQLKSEQYKSLRVVFGMVADKDIKSVVALLPKDAVYYISSPSTKRAIPVGELEAIMSQSELETHAFASAKEALSKAKQEYQEGDLIFIGGSNYLLADVLETE